MIARACSGLWGRCFTFIQGRAGHPLWTRARRVSVAAEIGVDHVCASASIPIVFPPVRVRTSEAGECWFGDSALRLVAPLSPAIRLGATRVFAIGIRCASAADALRRAELATEGAAVERPDETPPPLAQICGVFLNALFLDHLDSDLDHLARMNELVIAGDPRPASDPSGAASPPIRVVRPFVVGPSADLALVAAAFAHRMPRAVWYMLDGLGTRTHGART